MGFLIAGPAFGYPCASPSGMTWSTKSVNYRAVVNFKSYNCKLSRVGGWSGIDLYEDIWDCGDIRIVNLKPGLNSLYRDSYGKRFILTDRKGKEFIVRKSSIDEIISPSEDRKICDIHAGGKEATEIYSEFAGNEALNIELIHERMLRLEKRDLPDV